MISVAAIRMQQFGVQFYQASLTASDIDKLVRFEVLSYQDQAQAGFRLVLVTQHFEAHKLVDIAGRQGGLIELHAELLHPDSRYADHKSLPKESDSIVCGRALSTVFAQNRGGPKPVPGY